MNPCRSPLAALERVKVQPLVYVESVVDTAQCCTAAARVVRRYQGGLSRDDLGSPLDGFLCQPRGISGGQVDEFGLNQPYPGDRAGAEKGAECSSVAGEIQPDAGEFDD